MALKVWTTADCRRIMPSNPGLVSPLSVAGARNELVSFQIFIRGSKRLQDILFRAEPYTTHYATDNVARLVREAAQETQP